ncbi:MAG: o-succinylbenzoate synthase [Chloroflexi bacterium UTCFX4]|nr:MAG: o-succinylbenzoate synthase [Chloroflexi bacterium UTCFX4]
MSIDRIELRLAAMPLVAPFETSFGVETVEEHIIVRVDGDGITGWGECAASEGPWYSYETNQTAWHALRDFLIPRVFENGISAPTEFPRLVARVRGHNMAKAGLEGALWDWFAQAQNKSLAQMFNARQTFQREYALPERIVVGVSVGLQPTTGALLEQVRGYLQEGYTRVKIKIKPGRDVELARALRAEFPELRLQVDANSAYRLTDAAIFRAMDDLNLLLIEQPLSHDDIFQHSKLQRELKTALCLDESIHSVDDAQAALELGACRIINIKPGRVGGYTKALEIHDAAARFNAPVWCGGMLESGIGRAGNVAIAALPNFKLPGDLSASRRYYKQDIVEPEFEVDAKGTMRVPTAPGIGVKVVMKNLDAVTVSSQVFRSK